MTRCKFMVTKKSEIAYRTYEGKIERQVELTMQPVTGGSDENDKFFAATPSGEFKVGVIDPAAVADFNPGDEVFVDISLAGS